MSNKKEVLRAVAVAGLFLGGCNWQKSESNSAPFTDGGFPKKPANSVEIAQAPTPTVSGMAEEVFQSVYQVRAREHSWNFLGSDALITIEQARSNFGVTIFSPAAWNGLENLPWRDSEIAIVAQTLQELPPAYTTADTSPTQIALIKAPGTTSPGAGGDYSYPEIDLYISEYFLADAELYDMAGILYKTQKNYLRAALIHEWTHSFVEAQIRQNPEFLSEWIQKTGWVWGSEGWDNLRQEDLIKDGNAFISPNEDFAASAGLFLVNPDALSESRRNFFLTSPFYADWQTVLDYRNSH